MSIIENEHITTYDMENDPFLASKVIECLEMHRETDPESDSICAVCRTRLVVLVRKECYADVQRVLDLMIRPII